MVFSAFWRDLLQILVSCPAIYRKMSGRSGRWMNKNLHAIGFVFLEWAISCLFITGIEPDALFCIMKIPVLD